MIIERLDEYLTSFVVGVRFRANFSIEDELGNIIDKILYQKGAFFDPAFFPKVLGKASEKILFNETTENSLQINNSNIILEINSLGSDKRELTERICDNFEQQIISGIMKNYKITQINRIGYINRYLFKIANLAESFLDKSIGQTISGINDINLQFSRKYPVEESLIKKEVYDYHNAIFNIIKKSDQDELFVSVDYQKFFVPFLESSSQIEFKDFLNSVGSYNSHTFLNWLNENYCVEDNEKIKSSK